MQGRKYFLRSCAAAVTLLAASTVVAAADVGTQAVDAVARGQYASASELLRRLETTDRETFRANNYDYLLGRVLEQQGDRAAAAARYDDVVGRGSNLAEYALWRLARLAREEGNLPLERQYLTRLVTRHSSSLLYRGAVERLGRSALESGDYAGTVARLGPLAGTRGASARDALARVARAQLGLGDRTAARAKFGTLLSGSQDDYALAAARGLDDLDARERRPVSEVDRVVRGRVYLFNRDWAGARAHFEALADLAASPNRAESLYSAGLVAYRTNDHDAAVRWWEQTAAEFPSTATGIKAFYWVGHAHQRAGRFKEAVARYAEFIAKYPDDDQVEGAYRNAIDSLRSAGDVRGALVWCERAEAARPRSSLATFATFNRAKIRFGTGEFGAALAEFVRLETSYPWRESGPGMPLPGETALLKGICLERLGRMSEAASLYLAMLPKREDYFASRATERLIGLGKRPESKAVIEQLLGQAAAAARAAHARGDAPGAKAASDRALRLTEDVKTRTEMLAILRSSYAALPAYSRVASQSIVSVARPPVAAGRSGVTDRSHAALGAEFAFLGLYDEAVGELEASGLGARSPHSLAVYENRGGQAHDAIRLGESLVDRLPADYRVELLPRDVAELLYPAPYRDALRKFALPLNVDPRFELSIARQESRFKPWVKSPAAARGLVQFVPDTADRIAVALGLEGFDQDDLYDPHVSIRFGARYLANLFELFPGNPQAVAASYNGGEDPVARWLKRAADTTDPDLFVSEVGFKETKDYVLKVMNNYRAYKALYTPELNAQ
jgi:soluble lytic murein transglycosylase-like protein/TolA-binding protein